MISSNQTVLSAHAVKKLDAPTLFHWKLEGVIFETVIYLFRHLSRIDRIQQRGIFILRCQRRALDATVKSSGRHCDYPL